MKCTYKPPYLGRGLCISCEHVRTPINTTTGDYSIECKQSHLRVSTVVANVVTMCSNYSSMSDIYEM
jgi:transcription elongation factor Elf1